MGKLFKASALPAGQDAGLTPDLVEQFHAAVQDIDDGRRCEVEAVLTSLLGMGALGAAAALMRDL